MQQIKQRSEHQQRQQFWARVVMRKWLNMKESGYSADPYDPEDPDSNDSDNEEWGRQSSRFRDIKEEVEEEEEEEEEEEPPQSNEYLPRLRRQKSLTSRLQYINTKELRVCVGTWNVGGKLPPDDLDIDEWIGINDPADIYVLGFQEIVPLNPGNILGAEDTRPVPKWENIVRETLNRVRFTPSKVKSFSDPPSPSKFNPPADVPDIEEEILLESDGELEEEVHPIEEEHDVSDGPVTEKVRDTSLQATEAADIDNSGMPVDFQRQLFSPRRLNRLNCFRNEDSSDNTETPFTQQTAKLSRMLSGTERIGLSWPEPPLNLLSQKVLDRPSSFKSIKSFKASKSFKGYNSFEGYNSFKSTIDEIPSEIALLAETDLEALMKRKRKSPYVRITSKQMVGIFITIWVRRGLRKHIQNLKVSTVGVGVMGYIGNKGSISVSMSIYQTLFCFICTHLTAGEKEGDEMKRNADVLEIHRRTQFHSFADIGLPKSILDHESIIWLGDLNYRINLSYDETRRLISKKDWAELFEKDQLAREIEKGVFVGWSEGTLTFAPTYKYEMKSDKYYGEDPKFGRRTPSWCDRILSYGKGVRLLRYRRSELRFSDHRPVTATYMAEVEVFSPRKLQRALTFTDAEIENEEVMNLVPWN